MAKRHVSFLFWLYFIIEFTVSHLKHKLMRFLTKKSYSKEENHEVGVSGKVVIITGANTGLGKQTAIEMARRGAVVLMGCRNLRKGEVARKEIMGHSGSGTVELYKLDLGDLSSVQSFAAQVLQKHRIIDILINNAGIALDNLKREYTQEGWDLTMTTNHLGHFLLTNLLVESISASNIGRVVSLSSTTCVLSTLDTTDLMITKEKKLFGTMSYVNSKFCNGLFIKSLAKRYPGIKAYCMCPGLVKTEVFRNFEQRAFSKQVVRFVLSVFARTVEEAVDTVLLCSLGKQVENDSGGYFRFGKRFRWVEEMFKDEMAEELWQVSETLVNLGEMQNQLKHAVS